MLLKLVPLIAVFGVVLFSWIFLFPYLNRRVLRRNAERILKARRHPEGNPPAHSAEDRIAKRIILSNRVERIITGVVIALLAIFGILYLLRLISR